jgi:hypothetical protein
MIKNNGLVGSMGRVGAWGDNAAMESFFSLLQKNVLDRQRWDTRKKSQPAIITWIKHTYRRRRRQRRLGRVTPVEYDTLNLAATAARPPHPTRQLKSGQSHWLTQAPFVSGRSKVGGAPPPARHGTHRTAVLRSTQRTNLARAG